MSRSLNSGNVFGAGFDHPAAPFVATGQLIEGIPPDVQRLARPNRSLVRFRHRAPGVADPQNSVLEKARGCAGNCTDYMTARRLDSFPTSTDHSNPLI